MLTKDGGKTAGSALNESRRVAQQPTRQPSIKDIARLAHVSHPTVSRALQNSPLVNPATAERIRKIARDAGYRASAVARGLVMRRTKTIGLVVTTVDDPFASAVTCGVEQVANEHGYAIFLANSNIDPERERRMVQDLAERRVDGIIVTSSRVGSAYLPMLADLNIPMVLVNDQFPGRFVHSVMIANQVGSRLAVEHLIQLGHRRIAYISDRFGYESNADRLLGYREALAAAKIESRGELIVDGDSSPETAVIVAKQLIALPEPPTAICCYNDMTALGAIRGIHARGLRVPEDVSVTGFDDLFFSAYLEPPLTTIRQPMRRMGETAMENLFQLMSGEEATAQVKVTPELIVRKSTAIAKEHGTEHSNG